MRKESYIFNPHNKNLCIGCGACAQSCRKGALTMSEDAEGFLYPTINTSNCVECGLCETSCPIVNDSSASNEGTQKYYLAKPVETSFSKECATIGICTMVAEEVLKKGGHVFAVVLNEEDWRVSHIHVTTIDKLAPTRNSKYAQSNTGNSYTVIRELLKNGEIVLFTGTPCQVAGLKTFLRKDYKNLYTIDLVCHGVYSYKLLQKEVQYWEEKYNGKVTNFRFRSKREYGYSCGGMINFDLVCKGKAKHIERQGCSSPTYASYAYNKQQIFFNLRPSCYECKFRDESRYGDLTVGDSKGSTKHYKDWDTFTNDWYGTSLFSTNSENGETLYSMIKYRIITRDVAKSHFFNQNALKSIKRENPKERNEIYELLSNNRNYGTAISAILHTDFDRNMHKWKIKYYKKMIKKFIKTIIKR